ncbi:MAG TPA: NAD(P)/FAD-dependent oxidoreductase [Steroidobacteraceae bacterium]|jgi:phytoene dehydrogenase-like protein|nr:NAD(P)/FAD-dependent oxidoreductase [Steroidobacteraceae bacterium]
MQGPSPAPSRYDCVVIGAGHNGLVCAATLARGGRSVLLLEAAAQVGGAALTREFVPGFRVSAGAHLLHLMPAELIRDLKLENHGLEWAAQRMTTTALLGDSAPLALSPGAADHPGLSAADAAAYAAYTARMRRFAAALAPIFSKVPPRLGSTAWSDRMALLRMGWQIRKLGRRDMRELLRIGGMNVYDLLEENFESAALKGALGFDAVLGANFGPRSPGTVLTLLYRLAAESSAGASGLSQPKRGMGALCDALAKAAVAAGAVIRTQAPVANILVEADRACGVALESGERILAENVISSADPKTTFLKLLGTAHLDAGFVRRVDHIRSRGLAAKLHIALNRAPPFRAVSEAALRGRLLLAPSLQYIEHAYNHAKYGEFSASPVMEITVPSVNDPTLAPPGQHVLSAIVQYVPYALKEGWESARPRFLDAALDALERVAPGLRGCIVGIEVSTPVDLQREFRISGGHWHHGDLAFDQILMVRPVPGAAQYRSPVEGLFLCGAGCHPGGGVMGVAGRNAAQQVLKGGWFS